MSNDRDVDAGRDELRRRVAYRKFACLVTKQTKVSVPDLSPINNGIPVAIARNSGVEEGGAWRRSPPSSNLGGAEPP